MTLRCGKVNEGLLLRHFCNNLCSHLLYIRVIKVTREEIVRNYTNEEVGWKSQSSRLKPERSADGEEDPQDAT